MSIGFITYIATWIYTSLHYSATTLYFLFYLFWRQGLALSHKLDCCDVIITHCILELLLCHHTYPTSTISHSDSCLSTGPTPASSVLSDLLSIQQPEPSLWTANLILPVSGLKPFKGPFIVFRRNNWVLYTVLCDLSLLLSSASSRVSPTFPGLLFSPSIAPSSLLQISFTHLSLLK